MVLFAALKHVRAGWSCCRPLLRPAKTYSPTRRGALLGIAGLTCTEKKFGCRIDPDALDQWSLRHRAVLEAAPQWSAQRSEAQAWAVSAAAHAGMGTASSGRCTCPPCVRRSDASGRSSLLAAYFEEVARLAPRHGFGFVGRKRRRQPVRSWPVDRAAAYLSSYFVSGQGREGDIHSRMRVNPHLPRVLIWVSPRC